jgi:hypothetical protein
MNLKIFLCAAHDDIPLRNFAYCNWLDSDKEATCSILWVCVFMDNTTVS